MNGRSISVVAAAALVLALPAHGQNKCTDAQGKIYYQQSPCPGAVPKAPPPKPVAKTETPAAMAARQKCERIENDIREMKSVIPQLEPKQKARIEKSVANAEQEHARTCKK